MSANVQKFDRRLTRIVRKHRSLRNGYGFRVDRSGLITVKPKRAKSSGPLTAFLGVALIAVLFKAVVFANYGPQKYMSKLEPLRGGTLVEQAGAWLMEPGTLTFVLADIFSGILS
ncbi:hypothetical protein [uncultured Lentibacter sp.]|jgi:hypothetical protein|uniref:hypothetical protein n=1 Tax=uncultured Lentibacter sp. TaxID=1659309 RepID=UPI00260F55AE|nr:hypothetical protein [uncultured Lentibacter sp.]